jgi:3-hydroxybutyryl-CoA dehydratase
MNLKIGDYAEIKNSFCKRDVELFSDLTGDKNPIHLDETFAKQTIFKKPIVHGILTVGLISSVIANDLPGEGSIYLSQEVKFLKPVYHGDVLTARVEVNEILIEKNQVVLKTEVINQNNEVVITGTARVKNENIY